MNKKAILVVEDEPVERKLLVKVLQALEYEAIEAENGQQALDLLSEKNIDLILTDVLMPVMSGIELLEKLREAGHKLPVILMTGFEAGDAQKAMDAHEGSAVLMKPFRLKELQEQVEIALK
ncbi:response regulator [bacterium]|nr:response regulator [bacterium]